LPCSRGCGTVPLDTAALPGVYPGGHGFPVICRLLRQGFFFETRIYKILKYRREGVIFMRAKILVVDDDKKITALLRRSLVFEGYDVRAAAGGEEGLRIAASWNPGLVVLDVLMPGLDGWEVCRRLRAGGNIPILMLTARDEVADRVKGLDLGADDYLMKPFALEELLARIRALLRRKKPGEATLQPLNYAGLVLDHTTREVRRDGRPVHLTAREFDLLALFMEHPGQVLTRDLIMERVWGLDFEGESNVLEVYIGMLRQKLEDGGGKRVIQTVRGVGYVLKE